MCVFTQYLYLHCVYKVASLSLILQAHGQKGLALFQMRLWTVEFWVNTEMRYDFGGLLGMHDSFCDVKT